MDTLYHEKQRLQLCGAAAVNNLLQDKAYTRQSLNSIADQLPKIGTTLFFSYSSFMGIGNYSADVLIIALQQKGKEVTYFDKRKKAELEKILYDPSIEGLLVNRVTQKFLIGKSNHWLAILKLDKEWVNLDGKLDLPQKYKTTKEFIIEFLDKLHEESCFFIVYSKEQKQIELNQTNPFKQQIHAQKEEQHIQTQETQENGNQIELTNQPNEQTEKTEEKIEKPSEQNQKTQGIEHKNTEEQNISDKKEQTTQNEF